MKYIAALLLFTATAYAQDDLSYQINVLEDVLTEERAIYIAERNNDLSAILGDEEGKELATLENAKPDTYSQTIAVVKAVNNRVKAIEEKLNNVISVYNGNFSAVNSRIDSIPRAAPKTVYVNTPSPYVPPPVKKPTETPEQKRNRERRDADPNPHD